MSIPIQKYYTQRYQFKRVREQEFSSQGTPIPNISSKIPGVTKSCQSYQLPESESGCRKNKPQRTRRGSSQAKVPGSRVVRLDGSPPMEVTLKAE